MYFDKEQTTPAADIILANCQTQLTRSDFSTTVTNTTTGTIYYADTTKGRTYYFAGNPTDNWVKFGGFYWRIIRINEDGSIRMIYSGNSTSGPVTTGANTQIGTSVFNYTYGDNTYVGYMMGLDNQCTTGNCEGTDKTTSYDQSVNNEYDSTIKKVLDTWYQNNLAVVSDKIDGNAGFCGDRTYVSGSGYGANSTRYGANMRLRTNKQPTFECTNNSDLYTTSESSQGNRALTYPIGLITADEVAYAGAVWPQDNANDYLQTGQLYWTISPSSATYASVLHVGTVGIGGEEIVYRTWGVRPVINLSANVTITGSGTSTDPYVVVGAE